MTRTILTTLGASLIFASTAFAQVAPDVPETDAPDTAVCDAADFETKGQWVKCLTHSGIHGKELARRIHDEHQARKGGETTDRSKRRAAKAAKKASERARASKAKRR